jgi:5-methylcytosine-specific restriction endonuclease McrA
MLRAPSQACCSARRQPDGILSAPAASRARTASRKSSSRCSRASRALISGWSISSLVSYPWPDLDALLRWAGDVSTGARQGSAVEHHVIPLDRNESDNCLGYRWPRCWLVPVRLAARTLHWTGSTGACCHGTDKARSRLVLSREFVQKALRCGARAERPAESRPRSVWRYWAQRLQDHPLIGTRTGYLLKLQHGRCAGCGLYFTPGDLLECDHIIPRHLGGDDRLMNLQLLHRHCHDQKTARLDAAWAADMAVVSMTKTI